nr:hypothetical protein [Nocardioides convexus]
MGLLVGPGGVSLFT